MKLNEDNKIINRFRVKELVRRYIDMLIRYNPTKDILNSTIGREREGLVSMGENFVFLFPDILIGEYELSNPFIFGDVVVCPGHDSITCYNKVTGEHKIAYIR
jgi:hypothetical protein